MKYNDEILNKIAESYSKKIDENTNLDNNTWLFRNDEEW